MFDYTIKRETNSKRLESFARTGLTNLKKDESDDTSYLNALLQCLGNIYQIVYFLINSKNEEKIIEDMRKKESRKYPLLFVIQRLIYRLYPLDSNKKNESYSAENILKILNSKFKAYSDYKKKNPNDVINHILFELEDELNFNIKENKNTISNSEVVSLINYFCCSYLNEFNCKKCNSVSFEEQKGKFLTFQLDIIDYFSKEGNNDINLNELIQFDFKEKTQKKNCNNCNSEQETEMIKKINKSPKIFIFLLFNEDPIDKADELHKITFNIEEQIRMGDFIRDEDSPKNYEIFGIVSISMRERKYVSFSKSLVDKEWYLYNDEKVTKINFDFIKTSIENYNFYFPCILFYRSI